MNENDLREVLKLHSMWLNDRETGKRADLFRADLTGANLRGADLRRADLRGTYLIGAYLIGADLIGADLIGADLSGAYLRGAYLRGADPSGANLSGADLRGADLTEANLTGANLTGAKLPSFQLCPEEGSFVAWKAVRGAVLKLLISEKALRTSSLIGRKCRASEALVIVAYPFDANLVATGSYRSKHDENFIYTVDQLVQEPSYDGDIRVECTKGIHFFMTKQEALDY